MLLAYARAAVPIQPEYRFLACLQKPRRLIRFSSDDQLHDAMNTDCPDGARPVVRRFRQRVCHSVEDGIDLRKPLSERTCGFGPMPSSLIPYANYGE